MDFRDAVSGAPVVGITPARGARVHVSDASPKGFRGYVTAHYPDAMTVTRDNGTRELVIVSRRHVTVVTR
jgi:hypothetical protein